MFRYVVEAVLYNSCDMEIDRVILNENDISKSLASLIQDNWTLNDGDIIKIETNQREF